MTHYPDQPPPPPQYPQYPAPYEPPRFGGGPLPRNLLAPSRRASLLLLIIGGATVALALLVIAAGRYAPDEAVRQSQASFPKSGGPPPSLAALRTITIQAGILIAVVGVIFAGLGIAVRGGRKIPAIIAIGSAGVATIWLVGSVGSVLLVGGNPTGAICGLIVIVPIIVLLMMVIRALFQSLSTRHLLADYHRHAEMQQMYRQPPPPPPPGPADTIPDYNFPPPPPPNKPQ